MKPYLAERILGWLALLSVLVLSGCAWRGMAAGVPAHATASAGTPTPFQSEPVPDTPAAPGVSPINPPALAAAVSPTPLRAAIATEPFRVILNDGSSYVVQPGDSLPGIAQRFHLEPLDLMRANHIANASLIYAGQVLVIPGGTSTDKRILVDLSDQRLYAYEGQRQVFQFIVSTGAGDGTLAGSFHILDKIPRAFSDSWGFWMPSWMGIYYAGADIENGIHALPLLPDGEQIWGDSLGTPVSYGCVVLSPEDAQRLFAWAEVGTPVEIRQ